MERGLITPEQLAQALQIQNSSKSEGYVELLGDILVKHGYLDRQTLDQAITMQILQLRNALQEANHNLERKVVERTEQLQAALSKLSELDKLKSNFIANISHELRTPLTHIKGYQELMLAGAMGSLNPEQQTTMEVIKKASERLERLVDDLISISQVSRGEAGLKPSAADYKEMARSVLTRYESRSNEKQIALTVEVEENLPALIIDQQKISWALNHLVDNALKFTPQHGYVNVKIQPKSPFVQLVVEDNGIGIPAEKFQEVFEPFHQLDSNSSRKFGGTGIGLTLVKQITDAHKSDITVESEIGKFTRFTITLRSLQTSGK